MTEQAITTKTNGADILESVVIGGDLSKLSPAERVNYYRAVCTSLGLNPLTKPFDYITLNGRLTLYPRKDCTDQLRKIHVVSITRLERERIDDVYTVTAYAVDRDGRQDSSIGAVNIAGLKGDNLANAFMKAETKSKRRVTLSICGLGMLDETEIETVHDARPASVNLETGEISGSVKPEPEYSSIVTVGDYMTAVTKSPYSWTPEQARQVLKQHDNNPVLAMDAAKGTLPPA